MEQVGTVIVFKPEITEDQAETILENISCYLDHEPRVNTFDPKWGGPVWYIP